MLCDKNIVVNISNKTTTSSIFLDWTKLDLSNPYFDESKNKYFITVPTNHENPGNDKLNERKEEAKQIGVKALFEVYGKIYTDSSFNSILKTSEAVDIFISKRPSVKCGPNGEVSKLFGMKVLVAVKASEFDKLENTQVKINKTVPIAFKEIVFETNNFKNKIKDLSTSIKKYGNDVKKFKGKISGLDLLKISNRILEFYSISENLMIANKCFIKTEQNDLITFGINKDYEIIYVFFDNGQDLIYCQNAFNNFKKTKSVSDPNVIFYLTNVNDVLDIGKKKDDLPLTDFLKNFSLKTPDIKLIPDSIQSKQNVNFSLDELTGKHKKDFKTDADKESEDSTLASIDLKASLFSDNKDKTEFVGDTVLSVVNFNHLLKKVNSLEDLYQEVLNKISIDTLINAAIKCLPEVNVCTLVKTFLNNLANDKILPFLKEKVGFDLFNIPQLESFFKNEIFNCITNLSVDQQVQIFGSISNVVGFEVTIDTVASVSLSNIVSSLESLGLNFLKQIMELKNIKLEFREVPLEQGCIRLSVKVPDIEFPDLSNLSTEFEGFVNFNFDLNLQMFDIKIPEFPKFEVPTIDLDDALPTVDIMGSISVSIETSIIDALVDALVGTVKAIITGILENCGDLSDVNKFGELNMKQLLADSIHVDINASAFLDLKTKLFKNVIGAVQSVEQFANDIGNFLDDLSKLLTPYEVSSLLLGEPSEEVTQIVDCLVSTKYSALTPAFDSPSKIEDSFQSIGAIVNKDILLSQIVQKNIPSEQQQNLQKFGVIDGINRNGICVPQNEEVKQLFKKKGLTPQEIDDQIKKEEDRKNEQLENLLNLLNKDNILDGAIPPTFCEQKPGQNKRKGLTERDHPSFKHVLNKTVDVIYDGVYASFNQDILNLPTSLKETFSIKIPKVISRKVIYKTPKGDEVEIENPEFRRLVSQGVSVEDPTDLDGAPIISQEDLSFNTGRVASGLRQNLLNFETDDKLFKFNSIGLVRYSIPLIADQSMIDNINNGPDPQPIKDIIKKLNSIEYNIDYVLPDNSGKYQFRITKQNGLDNNPISIFESIRQTEIPKEILFYIKNNNLIALNDVALAQSHFGSFISNIWQNGGKIYDTNQKELKLPDYAKGLGTTDKLLNYFAKDIYGNIFRDLSFAVSKQVSKSPLFDIKTLSLVNFAPTKDPHCDGHLLNIENIKQKMKDDFNNNECSENIEISQDGLGKTSLNSLEQAGVSGAVITFVRLFAIEAIVKSIFAFSEFRIKNIDELDEAVLDYYIKSIINEITVLGKNDDKFFNQFKEQLVITFNKKIDNKEINEKKTKDFNIALLFFIKEQLISVIDRFSKILGIKDEFHLNENLINEWLPLFDVANGSDRLKDPGTTISKLINKNSDKEVIFNLKNGNFILEKYIRFDNDIVNSNINALRKQKKLQGVISVNDWENFIQGDVRTVENNLNNNTRLNLKEEFGKWSYGLRLVYIPPVNDSITFDAMFPPMSFVDSDVNKFTHNIFTSENGTKLKNQTLFNKSLRVFEGTNSTIDGLILNRGNAQNPQTVTYREINSFPIVSVEIEEIDLDKLDTTININERWLNNLEQLKKGLMETPEYKFIFSYCFSIEKIMSLIILYNNLYVGNIKRIDKLFENTKNALKTVFQSLLNVGNYKYEDNHMTSLGGNVGISNISNNNINTEPDVPGFSLAAMAAKTPLLILKGLVEITDQTIGRAREVVEKAKENNESINILGPILSQLPMNIIPPPPIGPGIGAPITPFGFIYMALDVDSTFDSAKGKELKRDSIKADIDLNFDKSKICDEK